MTEQYILVDRKPVRCDDLMAWGQFFKTQMRRVGSDQVGDAHVSKDTENARFTKATPWGEIRLGSDNPAALNQFEAGKSYYVDFTPAE